MHSDDFEIPKTKAELYDPGLYRWRCTSCKLEDNPYFDASKPVGVDGNDKQKVLITWLFVGGQYDGITFYDRCALKFSEGSKLGQRAKGANGWAVIPDDVTFKPALLVGKEVDAGLVVEPIKMGPNKGQPGNQVTFMRPAEGAPPAAVAPVAQAIPGYAVDDIPFDY